MTTLKSDSRLVVVDVVATGADGNPVHGLPKDAFSILENGTEQQIRTFEEHSAATPNLQPEPDLHLPPDVHTNYMATPPAGAVIVILLDTLNTAPEDIVTAREQLMSYVARLPKGSHVALFVLANGLEVAHGFTDNTDELIEAAKAIVAKRHTVLKTSTQTRSEMRDKLLAMTNAPPSAARAVVNLLTSEYQGEGEARVSYTLEALKQFARAVATIRGRKSLIWISDSFPLMFSDSDTRTNDRIRNISAVLAAEQITVFPVDARRLHTSIPGADNGEGDKYGANSAANMAEMTLSYETMAEFASQTGGRVYHNTNDLTAAIENASQLGSNYYTIAYRPSNHQWNGKYRKIAVRCERKGVKLLHRPGYFAVADPLLEHAKDDESFRFAMAPFAPISTSLIMKARVLPATANDAKVKIDLLLDARDIAWSGDTDHHKASLRYMAVAWDDEGRSAGTFGSDFAPNLKSSKFTELMRTGLQVRETLAIKPGNYTLRVGVWDRNSGRIGTIDTPIVVPAAAVQVGTPSPTEH